MKKIILILLITFFRLFELFAAVPSTQGSEFYFSFNKARPSRDKNMKLTVSSAKNGVVKITDALGTSVTKTFTSGTTTIDLAYADNNDANEVAYLTGLTSCYTKTDHIVADRGYIVESFESDGTTPLDVSLYAGLSGSSTTDAANIYPIEALGNEYYILSHLGFSQSGDILSSEALVVASEDNTEIEIIPTCLLANQLPEDDLKNISITLNKGQSYQIRALGLMDLTGTVIRTKDDGNLSGNKCKKLAVFAGNQHGWPGDYEYEQIFPTHLWGTKYLMDAPDDGGAKVIRVVASKPCTHVTINGTLVATLNQTNYYDYVLNVLTGSYIETDKPVGVAMYTADFITNIRTSNDAAMIVLAPIEQNLDSIIFTGISNTGTPTNIVSIIAQTQYVDDVTFYQLDGTAWTPIPLSGWTPNSSNATYSSITSAILPTTTYKIISTKGGFNAYVYGYGNGAEYGYSAGSAAKLQTPPFTVNGVITSGELAGKCVDKPITLKADFDYDYERIDWDFGDGSTTTTYFPNDSTNHTYVNPGDYPIKMTVFKNSSDCFSGLTSETSDIITIKNTISSKKDTTLCKGSSIKSNRATGFVGTPKYYWSTSTPTDSIKTESITLTDDYGTTNKLYWVKTYDANCNSYIDTIYVNVTPIQTAAPITLSPQCKGTSISSTRTSADFGGNTPTYLWNTGQTTASITLSDDYGVTKKYWVVSTYKCAIADTFVVNIKPIVKTVYNKYLCNNKTPKETISFSTNTPEFTGTPSYLWNTGETTSSIEVKGTTDPFGITTKHWVEATQGCKYVDTIFVTVPAEVINQILTSPPHVCEGTSVTLQASQTGPVTSYGWFIGSTSIANGVLSINNEMAFSTTIYTFKSIGDCQTVDKDVEVKVNPKIDDLLLTPDPMNVQPGQLVNLTATTTSLGSYIYTWSSNAMPDANDKSKATDIPSVSGNKTYSVTAKDADALCSSTANATITVGKLPTAITPYSSGSNDKFIPGYDHSIVIFNRIGQQIFAGTFTQGDGWDGTNQLAGNTANPGVYYYIINNGTTKGAIEVVKK